jgi:hypothetical protein
MPDHLSKAFTDDLYSLSFRIVTKTMEPPPYDSLADVPLLSSNDGASSEPPAYDRRLTPPPIAIQLRELREFTSEIPTGNGTPWAILTIQGDRRLSKTMPTVLEGSNLVGSVKFLLQSSESFHAVCILVGDRYSWLIS